MLLGVPDLESRPANGVYATEAVVKPLVKLKAMGEESYRAADLRHKCALHHIGLRDYDKAM
jgi:hypothetical protein